MLMVAGEALVDQMARPDGSIAETLGGSPCNLALALGRLGRSVAYCSPLSSDRHGRQFASLLSEAGVKLGGGWSELPTSRARVSIDAEGQASYIFERDGVADRSLAPLSLLENWPGEARFFHVGSLALIPPDGQAWCELLHALPERGVSTSVDLNMRPMAAPDGPAYIQAARAAAARAQWLKVSDDDLRAIGLDAAPLQAARQLLGEQTRVVLLTLGARGAYALTHNEALFQPAPSVEVVDTVGAGDCFYAGFLAALDESGALQRQPTVAELQQALSRGSAAAAFSLRRAGCQAPWRGDLSDSDGVNASST